MTPNKAGLRQALQTSPVMIAIGLGRGYWSKIAPPPRRISAYHAVVLTGIDDNGNYEIFDSLTVTKNFDGYHKLRSDYPIVYAVSFIDLPNKWKDIQNKENAKHGALNHYGEKRDLAREQGWAAKLSLAIEPHTSLHGFFGKEWTIAVNALTYGNYTIIDLLNHFTSIKRGWGPIWDLNEKRKW